VSVPARTRVVFDTNVVLSALLFTNGRLSWLVEYWQADHCVPLVSRGTAAELTRILAYPKFRLTPDEQLEALGSYIAFCDVVEVVKPCSIVCRDPKDRVFLDLAVSDGAEVLVSGDEDLLTLAGQTGFTIQTPEEYRQRVAGRDGSSAAG